MSEKSLFLLFERQLFHFKCRSWVEGSRFVLRSFALFIVFRVLFRFGVVRKF